MDPQRTGNASDSRFAIAAHLPTDQPELMAAAVQHLPDGVVVTDSRLDQPGPRILYANPAICEITGYDAEELLGRTPRMLQGPDTSAETCRFIRRELAAGRACRVSVINYRKNGSPYEAELSISPIFAATGQLTHFVSLHRNVSDHESSDGALRESEFRYRLLADHAEDFVMMNDCDGNRLYVSPSFYRVTGWTPEEMQAGDWRSRLHPDEAGLIERTRAANLRGEATRIEHRVLCKDGRWLWVENCCRPVLGPDGQVRQMVLWSRDITDRKRADQRVRESEQRFRKIFENAVTGIAITNCAGEFLQANAAYCTMLGYTEEELRKRTFPSLVAPEDRAENRRRIRRLAAGEFPSFESENRYLKKSGEAVWVNEFFSVLNDERGSPECLIALVTDISQRRELQRMVLEIAAEEGRRIGYELHDNIQQQLTGWGLLAQNLAETLAAHSPENAALAERLAQGIGEAARQVHWLSRGLVPVEVDAEGLRAALSDLAAEISEQSRIVCELICEEPVAVNDNFVATHLYRIAQEAVNNALKHSRTDRIEIGLRQEQTRIVLQIADRGIGGCEQFRAGMGRKLMRYRADLIGATIRYDSPAAGGTRVTCELPASL